MNHVLSYSRIANSHTDFGLSKQENAIKQYAAKNELKVIGFYRDIGSGFRGLESSELARMNADIFSKRVSVEKILICNASRLSRDHVFVEKLLKQYLEFGISVFSVLENLTLTEDKTCRLVKKLF